MADNCGRCDELDFIDNNGDPYPGGVCFHRHQAADDFPPADVRVHYRADGSRSVECVPLAAVEPPADGAA